MLSNENDEKRNTLSPLNSSTLLKRKEKRKTQNETQSLSFYERRQCGKYQIWVVQEE